MSEQRLREALTRMVELFDRHADYEDERRAIFDADAALAAPIAAPADEARDAARYRYLCDNESNLADEVEIVLDCFGFSRKFQLDDAIDAAMATPAGSKPE